MSTHARRAHVPTADEATHLETERVETCPLCGSVETRPWRSNCRDWQQVHIGQRFEYAGCAQCSAYFLTDRPLESELRKVYFAGYGPYQALPGAMPEPPGAHPVARATAPLLRMVGAAIGLPLQRRLSRMLEWAYRPESAGETLLDYGCGSPTFLDGVRARGFTTVGVDFTEDVLGPVRASGHAAHLVGEEFERNVPDGSVSSVRMNHVVEHLYRPREALAVIRQKMRAGGRVHISTPDPGSIGSRLFRRRWHALDCPRHVILYRPAVLRELLKELGFEEISFVHEVGPKDLTRSWGLVLYERGRIEHAQIAAMATDRVRSGLFWPVASLGAILSSADRYHLFARA